MGDDWRVRLEKVGGQSNCRITTRGRKTGRPHTVTIWFAVGSGATVYLATLNVDRDWPKNVAKDPEVVLDFGELRLKGRARSLANEAGLPAAEELLRSKYWVSRIGSWFGLRPQGIFEVAIEGEAPGLTAGNQP